MMRRAIEWMLGRKDERLQVGKRIASAPMDRIASKPGKISGEGKAEWALRDVVLSK